MSKRMILAASIAATSLTFSGTVWAGAADQSRSQGTETTQTPADQSSQDGQTSPSNMNDSSSGQTGMDQSRSEQQSQEGRSGQELAQTEQQSIRQTLATATDAVLNGNGLGQLNESLAPEDRARLNDTSQGASALKEQVDQFRQSWKDKYGSDFEIKNDKLALADIQIQASDQLGEARLAGERNSPERSNGQNPNSSGQSSGMDNQATTQPSGANGSSTDNDTSSRGDAGGSANSGGSSSEAGAQANRANRTGSANGTAQGMNMATATIPQSHGLPQVSVNLVQESAGRWCIDLPDSVGAQQLQDNLVRHLTMINQDKSSWPADANEAYMLVSHHVMAALTDTHTGSSSGIR